MNRFLLLVALLFLLFLQHNSSAQICNANSIVAGYVPNYRNPNAVDYTQLTHALYFNLTCTTTGGINPQPSYELPVLASFLSNCNTAGIKKLVTVTTGDFPTMTATPSNIPIFADTIRKYCQHHGFDGVDIDWESISSSADSTGYSALMKVLHDTLFKYNLELVATVGYGNYWLQWYSNSAVLQASWMQIMVYDETGTWSTSPFGNPSTFQDFLDAETYWVTTRGISRSNIVMGLPLYGATFASTSGGNALPISYADIVSRYPAMDSCSNETPCNNYTFFNGPNLIRKKVNYAISKGFKGVFMWEMGQDASGTKALHLRVWDEYNRACSGLAYTDICTTDLEPCLATAVTNAQETQSAVWYDAQNNVMHFSQNVSEGTVFNLSDTMGRLVWSSSAEAQQNTVSLPLLPDGLYIFYLNSGNQKSFTRIFVVN